MSENIYLILFLISIFLIGLFSIIKSLSDIEKKNRFTLNFFDMLKKYIQSAGRDTSTYSWLTSKSPKMQRYIGIYGIMQYQPAYRNYVINHYELIINGLSELSRYYDDSLLDSLSRQMGQTLQESIIRYLGVLEESREVLITQRKNPVVWFREGIKFILSIPFKSLVWFDILNSSIVIKITSNILFKSFSGLIALITFLSTVITIVLGYEQFTKYLLSFFN